MFLVPLTISMANVKAKYRGRIVGLVNTFYWLGSSLFAHIYEVFFEASQNVRGYFLTCSVIYLGANMLSLIFVKYYIPSSEDNEQSLYDFDNTPESESHENTPIIDRSNLPIHDVTYKVSEDLTGLQLLKSIDFHLIALSFLLLNSIEAMFIVNLTAYLYSYKHVSTSGPLLIIGPLVAAFFSLMCGLISDIFVPTIPRSLYLLIISILQTILLSMCITSGSNMVLFSVTTLTMYAGNGSYFSLTPLLISEYFGQKYFSHNWGGLMLSFALLGWFFETIFGLIYDNHVKLEDRRICYGQECFTGSFIMATVVSFVGTVLGLILVWREKKALHLR